MSTTDTDKTLNGILKKSQTSSDYSLLPEELACLTSVFLSNRPDAEVTRPKGYVVLSKICQSIREREGKGKEPEAGTQAIVSMFGPTVLDYLKETNEKLLMAGITFLTALFQVDAQAASNIFVDDGLVENMMDSVDLSPSNLLCQEVAHLLGQACGHKVCRAIMTPQIQRWLDFKSRQSTDTILQSAASVALIKFARGATTDNPENGQPEDHDVQTGELTTKLVDIIVSEKSNSYSDAVEGLAYLSTDSVVKQKLAKNTTFLKRLYSLVPTQKTGSLKNVNHTLVFGVILIICNLTSFRPRLTEEQKQMEKLKQMAKAGKDATKDAESKPVFDDDDHVKARIRLLVASGVLPVFPSAIAVTDSAVVRANVGKSLLSIIEEKENRGKVLQAGGARVLQAIIKQALSTQNNSKDKKQHPNLTVNDLEAIQALAKLAITSSPVQVFGPNIGVLYDAIRPFSTLLQHTSSNMLQQFEAIMALTNLASHSADVATRIATADGLLNKVELLLLDDHTLIRRASVELICNLIAGSDEAFERYSGDTPNSANKIHVLLALSDEDDMPTRLAASGALATVTIVPTACAALIALQFEKHRFLTLITQLIDPSVLKKGDDEDQEPLETSPGLVHRGVVCVCNVFKSITNDEVKKKIVKEATDSCLLQALAQLIKGEGVVKDQAILQQAAEALKLLIGTTN